MADMEALDCRMGTNKNLRQKIEAETKQINLHYDKIKKEKAKKNPDKYNLRVWYRHLDKHIREREKLLAKLPGGKK